MEKNNLFLISHFIVNYLEKKRSTCILLIIISLWVERGIVDQNSLENQVTRTKFKRMQLYEIFL